VAGGRKLLPAHPAPKAKPEDIAQLQAAAARGEIKLRRFSVRLAYNELTSLAGLVEAMEGLLGPLARWELTWLDLSHNKLATLDEALLQFPNLMALYLHGNQISMIQEVRKLHVLTRLEKLSVHGNPLYQEKLNHGLRNPRSAVIYHLRNCLLKSLDFITLTNGDRRNALRWAEQNKPKKKRPVTDGEEREGSPTRR
jgi:hypothetical protein